MSTPIDIDSLRAELAIYGQEHLLQFWDTLSPEQQQELVHDIKE